MGLTYDLEYWYTGLDSSTVIHCTLWTSEGGMCPRRRCFSLHRDIRALSFSVTVVFCVTFLVRLSLVGHDTGEARIALEDAGSASLAETMAVRRERVVRYCKNKQPAAGPARGGQISDQNRYLFMRLGRNVTKKQNHFILNWTLLFYLTALSLFTWFIQWNMAPDLKKTI